MWNSAWGSRQLVLHRVNAQNVEVAFVEYQPSVPNLRRASQSVMPDAPISPILTEQGGVSKWGKEGMPLKTFDADLSNFDQVFRGFTKPETPEGSPSEPRQLKFLLFLADKDPSTNRSWCPDCNVAEPIIYEKLEASNSNLVLLRAYVGDRPTWRNPSHPWKVDPRFKLKGVPTLIRWDNEAVAGRLEDYEAHIGDKIDSILASN